MAEKIAGATVYVTHREMNGVLWKIIFAIAGACMAILTAVVSAQISVSEKFEKQAQAIADIRQDVAVIKSEVAALARVVAVPTQDVQQAQYVLVQLPDEAEMRNKNVRDILIHQGLIDGTP